MSCQFWDEPQVMDSDRRGYLSAAIVTLSEEERLSKRETLKIAAILVIEPGVIFDRTHELHIHVEFNPAIQTHAGVVIRMAQLHKLAS